MSTGRWSKAVMPVLAGVVLVLLPVPEGLEPHAWRFFALFVATILGLILEPIPTVPVGAPLREAAALIVEGRGNIVAVLESDGTLAGVLTSWDIARAVAEGADGRRALEAVMTREVIAVPPTARIPEIVRELEQNRISAMPVVDGGRVLGVVSSDLLAQRYLPQLLRAQAQSAAAVGARTGA